MKKKYLILFSFLTQFFWGVLILTQAEASNEDVEPKGITQQTILKSPEFNGLVPKVRLKDITHFEGVRENQLVGYGLVVGLNGSGDTLASAPYTKESLTSMLERLGVNIRDNSTPSGKNVAAVMVTATLPSFTRAGSKIDVTVSALGDAKDLKGGTLLVTPLLAADGDVYAVAQGPVSVSGFTAQGKAASATKGVPTAGKIPNGAIIEKEVGFELAHLKSLHLTLNNPDFTTAQRISGAINHYFKHKLASALDSSTVQIQLSPQQQAQLVSVMTEIEQLKVEPDQTAKVLIDDQSGVIVIGHNVKINPIALTHGNITVRIVETPQVSQPNPFTNVVSGNTPIGIGNTTTNVTANQQTNNTAISTDQTNALLSQQQAELANLQAQHQAQITAFTNAHGLAPYAAAVQPLWDQLQQQQAQQAQQLRQNHQQQLTQLQQQQQLNSSLQNQQQLNGQKSSTQLVPVQQATVIDNSKVTVKEDKGKFALLESGASLEEFVNALNLLGASPRDMSSILHSIKAAGAMQAEIVVR